MSRRVIGLGVKYNPPCIGVHYDQAGHKKLYNIKLNRLLFTPSAEEAAMQLLDNHKEYLKGVSVEKLAELIEKIQDETKVFEDYEG